MREHNAKKTRAEVGIYKDLKKKKTRFRHGRKVRFKKKRKHANDKEKKGRNQDQEDHAIDKETKQGLAFFLL